LDSIVFPLDYTTVPRSFSFIPLDKQNEFTIDNILNTLDVGKNYGNILNNFNKFPLLFDTDKKVLSFPPIINGDVSKITLNTKNLFIEVTSTNDKSAQEIISLLSFELYDMGFTLFTVETKNNFNDLIEKPNVEPLEIIIDPNYINKILGLDLTDVQIIKCLEKSRCSGKSLSGGIECCIPRYRIDIFNPVDICEEVAMGYGIYKLITLTPSLYLPGKKHIHSIIFNNIREILIGLGFVEIINTNIISQKLLNNFFLQKLDYNTVSVSNSQNNEFEILRNSIIPSMMITLSKNIHEKYPQKLFEIGKIFQIQNSKIVEEWNLGIVIAHNNTDYSEIKSVLESFIKYCFNKEVKTPRIDLDCYLEGHSAKILLDDREIGNIGEISPLVLEKFKLRTLVTSFQINLDFLMELLDINRLRYI
jgi:phenylalanyl-tRNA synthetase beta chain